MLLRELPTELRPRERLTYAGPSALSNTELLAITLGSGRQGVNAIRLAEELLAKYDGLTNLARVSPEELAQHAGIGPAKAAQIVAAYELGRRMSVPGLTAMNEAALVIRSPQDLAYHVMADMANLEQEELRVALFNVRQVLIKIVALYRGNIGTAVVRVGEIFRDAVRLNASSIILIHNHPSGDPTPSPEDVRVTEQVVEAGNLFDIQLMDHLIIGRNRFVSLKERGLGFGSARYL
jgi:DNA repair protein RadC